MGWDKITLVFRSATRHPLARLTPTQVELGLEEKLKKRKWAPFRMNL